MHIEPTSDDSESTERGHLDVEGQKDGNDQSDQTSLNAQKSSDQLDESKSAVSLHDEETDKKTPWYTSIVSILGWTPPRCRWDPANPPKFTIWMNTLFAFAGTFTVANLYYSHPILDVLARYFQVSHERASLIPTCCQAGYAAGLIFLCPLGDLVRRRHFVLLLTLITATLWLGLCFTKKFEIFLAFSFLTSITTVTPQVMLPLVADLAPPARRATALSIVGSGLTLGLLFARVLSGVIAQYSDWRNIYWLAFAVQYLIFILLWLFMPDYPSVNSDISYFEILFSILRYFTKLPVLVQVSLSGFLLSATFTSFWTTLTFLLSGDPYHFSSLIIGFFAFAGMVPLILSPLYSRYIIDIYIPQFSILLSHLIILVGISVGTFAGKHSVAGPIIQAAVHDLGLQASQIVNRTALYTVAPKARSRTNTGYMVGVFCGQLAGTAVGNRVFAQSGWVVTGIVSLAFTGGSLVICLIRGPLEERWIGWRGGVQGIRKQVEGR